MSLTQIFKRIIIPCAAGATHVPATEEGHTYGINCAKNPNANQGTKPSDLPLYSKECSVCREANQTPPPPSSMEETVGNIRRELWVWQDNLRGYRHKIVDVYRKGFSKAGCPESNKRRNPLENSLDDKPRKCQPTTPLFEKLHMNRCGRPCVGDHRYSTQCKHEPATPPPVCRPCRHEPPATLLPICKPCMQKRQEIAACPPKRAEPVCPPKQKEEPDCPPKKEEPVCPPKKEEPCPAKEPYDPCKEVKQQQQSKSPSSRAIIDYLREPPHGPHRVGAIALSGMAGYILGMRRGMFRRFFYSASGMLGMAYICYPEETKDCVETVVLEGRRYFIVAYHFVCGDTPKTLENYTGPFGPKEGKLKTIEMNSESKKAMLSEEKPAKEKKT